MKPSALFANCSHPLARVLVSALGKTLGSVQFLNARIVNRAGPDKAAANRTLQKNIQEEMKRTGCAYDMAFNRLAKAHFANSEDANKIQSAATGTGGIPTATPGLIDLFRLPKDTTPGEWRAAFEGNSSVVSPINYAAIFSALTNLIQKQTGKDLEACLAPTKDRFPDLWSAVEEQSKLSF